MLEERNLLDNKEECVEVVDKKSERTKKGYYRCMDEHKDLYNEMLKRYQKYITHTYLKQCRHEFDTQMN